LEDLDFSAQSKKFIGLQSLLRVLSLYNLKKDIATGRVEIGRQLSASQHSYVAKI
jgi:hypothetical protein